MKKQIKEAQDLHIGDVFIADGCIRRVDRYEVINVLNELKIKLHLYILPDYTSLDVYRYDIMGRLRERNVFIDVYGAKRKLEVISYE